MYMWLMVHAGHHIYYKKLVKKTYNVLLYTCIFINSYGLATCKKDLVACMILVGFVLSYWINLLFTPAQSFKIYNMTIIWIHKIIDTDDRRARFCHYRKYGPKLLSCSFTLIFSCPFSLFWSWERIHVPARPLLL